ncbi:hypothetical protein [Aureivirga sp. CE67]|uniref:hypothetical protein n=1 Tax=Aureivirga sp. CE67 TaxID=1788983 RepID=UPI0018C9625D|nr:hypothetical protein [Aureivirga sp. CE67]
MKKILYLLSFSILISCFISCKEKITQKNNATKFLNQMGIQESDENLSIHEYKPVAIDWFSKEHKTAPEIEISTNDDATKNLSVVFVEDIENVTLERVSVFSILSYEEGNPIKEALLSKELCAFLNKEDKYTFEEDFNAYKVTDSTEIVEVFDNLKKIIGSKKPIDFEKLRKAEEPIENLNYLLEIMQLNNAEFSKYEIREYLNYCLENEGKEYIESLKKAVRSNGFEKIDPEYKLSKKDIKNIKTSILVFKI